MFTACCSQVGELLLNNLQVMYTGKLTKVKLEISAFNLGLPDCNEILTDLSKSVPPKVSAAHQKKPWGYQEVLETFYTGQNNIIGKPHECVEQLLV